MTYEYRVRQSRGRNFALDRRQSGGVWRPVSYYASRSAAKAAESRYKRFNAATLPLGRENRDMAGLQAPATHGARASRWIEQNPDIFAMIEKYARDLYNAGQGFSAKMIVERVRWECRVAKRGEYKLNNNNTAYIARELLRRHPEYRKWIQIRTVRHG